MVLSSKQLENMVAFLKEERTTLNQQKAICEKALAKLEKQEIADRLETINGKIESIQILLKMVQIEIIKQK